MGFRECKHQTKSLLMMRLQEQLLLLLLPVAQTLFGHNRARSHVAECRFDSQIAQQTIECSDNVGLRSSNAKQSIKIRNLCALRPNAFS